MSGEAEYQDHQKPLVTSLSSVEKFTVASVSSSVDESISRIGLVLDRLSMTHISIRLYQKCKILFDYEESSLTAVNCCVIARLGRLIIIRYAAFCRWIEKYLQLITRRAYDSV